MLEFIPDAETLTLESNAGEKPIRKQVNRNSPRHQTIRFSQKIRQLDSPGAQ
jgi:hypothetical protein